MKERSLVNRHNAPNWHGEEPDKQDQPTFSARSTQSSGNTFGDFDQFPFLPVAENPSSQEAHKNDEATVQDSSHRGRRVLWQVLLTLVFIVLAFWGGWFAHQYFGQQPFHPSSQSQSYSQLIQQAWTDIDQHYVDRKTADYKKMSYAAIEAMVNSLGDTGHSHFADPQMVDYETHKVTGKFTGIGLSFQQDSTTRQWTVSQIIPNGPADKAGLKLYDVIKSINGVELAASIDENATRGLALGSAGTNVTFVIQRLGESQARTFSVTIAEINVPNVIMYYIPQSHVAHIQIVTFVKGVASDVRDDIRQAKAMGATKFIIDLRNNPGGDLDEAVKMSSLFLASGNVLLEQDSTGQRTSISANGNPLDTTSSIVVLVNKYTASAAEIVTAALQENHRATVLGTKTFGTGTVVFPFPLADGSALYLGTKEWLTPNGHSIRKAGVDPNIQVDPNLLRTLMPNEEQKSHMSQQQILNSGDSQLAAAIQYLNQQK